MNFYTGNITFVLYDYIPLYSHLAFWKDQWMTCTVIILNAAIRDYYLTFKEKHIDIEWLNMRMKQIANNENVLF